MQDAAPYGLHTRGGDSLETKDTAAMLTIAVLIGKHRLARKHRLENARYNALLLSAARSAAEVEL